MKKSILNVGKVLSRAEQKNVFGGNSMDEGNTTVYCNSGVGIENAPDCSPETVEKACRNQGGFKGFCIQF